jgi:hypothetical protein
MLGLRLWIMVAAVRSGQSGSLGALGTVAERAWTRMRAPTRYTSSGAARPAARPIHQRMSPVELSHRAELLRQARARWAVSPVLLPPSRDERLRGLEPLPASGGAVVHRSLVPLIVIAERQSSGLRIAKGPRLRTCVYTIVVARSR